MPDGISCHQCHRPAAAPLFSGRNLLKRATPAVRSLANGELAPGHSCLSHPSSEHRQINVPLLACFPIQCLGSSVLFTHLCGTISDPGPFPKPFPCHPICVLNSSGLKGKGREASGLELASLCRHCPASAPIPILSSEFMLRVHCPGGGPRSQCLEGSFSPGRCEGHLGRV